MKTKTAGFVKTTVATGIIAMAGIGCRVEMQPIGFRVAVSAPTVVIPADPVVVAPQPVFVSPRQTVVTPAAPTVVVADPVFEVVVGARMPPPVVGFDWIRIVDRNGGIHWERHRHHDIGPRR